MKHALATVSLLALATALGTPAWADALLAGSITSASGEKMGGVAVSAKADGSTITTSVYTDESGAYYFPPLPEGKYRIWAQAIKFQTAKGEVELAKTTKQNFVITGERLHPERSRFHAPACPSRVKTRRLETAPCR